MKNDILTSTPRRLVARTTLVLCPLSWGGDPPAIPGDETKARAAPRPALVSETWSGFKRSCGSLDSAGYYARIFPLRAIPKGLCYSLSWTAIVVLLTQAIGSLPAQAGPYPPAAGQPGSTAIHMLDPRFTGWATGWSDYDPGENVDSTWRTPARALGRAAGNESDVVSLGDGGSITLTFGGYLSNQPGPDFAVFENSFNDTFLELAWVEVSSDGSNFYRFDNQSKNGPVGGFGSVDPTNITGYAGKYRQGYGTPFDLDPLYFLNKYGTDLSGLDLDRVTHIRIVDIVGNGNYLDTFGNSIFDPTFSVDPEYPSSAGFDLDAVGAINFTPTPVPLPASFWLLTSGLIGLSVLRRQIAMR